MSEDENTSAPQSPPPRDPNNHPLTRFAAARAAGRPLFVQAPMVRYSKLPFRALVRDYGVDIAYTPMILAKEFVRSEQARQSDFTSNDTDVPLVVQFGAHEPVDFARAAELVAPYCDGVDLNCGCPQSWAIAEGVGAALMRRPEVVAQMVREVRRRVDRRFCVSVKIRVHNDVEETRRWVQTVLETGAVDYVTVHGRTRCTRSSVPVDLDKIRSVAEVCRRFGTPVLANGDVFSLEDAHRIAEYCGVDGVMAARGLMTNPALFAGFKKTPWGAVERFMDYAMAYPIPFRLVQHHVFDMLDQVIPKKERVVMNETTNTIIEMIDWLDERFVLRRRGEPGFGESVEIERRIIAP